MTHPFRPATEPTEQSHLLSLGFNTAFYFDDMRYFLVVFTMVLHFYSAGQKDSLISTNPSLNTYTVIFINGVLFYPHDSISVVHDFDLCERTDSIFYVNNLLLSRSQYLGLRLRKSDLKCSNLYTLNDRCNDGDFAKFKLSFLKSVSCVKAIQFRISIKLNFVVNGINYGNKLPEEIRKNWVNADEQNVEIRRFLFKRDQVIINFN